jgi:hypothetical protein
MRNDTYLKAEEKNNYSLSLMADTSYVSLINNAFLPLSSAGYVSADSRTKMQNNKDEKR